MGKKVLSLFLAVVLILGMATNISFAAELVQKAEFFDAVSDGGIDDLNKSGSVYAKLSFTAKNDGTAKVIAALYKDNTNFDAAYILGTAQMTKGQVVEYTTPDIAIGDADLLKILVWDASNTIEPVTTASTIAYKADDDSDVTIENGVTTESVKLSANNASAEVPEGVAVSDGADALTLSMEALGESQSGIEAGETEELTCVDVHIEGVSEANTVPIIVTLENVATNGINSGNISLYHVEADGTKEMTRVASEQELDSHNEYIYDPENGTLMLALSSFSEVAILSDTVNSWNGTIDTELSGAGTKATPYIISNADELAGMSKLVSTDNDTYGSAYYRLNSDVNFGGSENGHIFYPVGWWKPGEGENAAGETKWYTYGGAFSGTFDGAGHKVSGIYQNTWAMDGDYSNGYYNDAMGLFGYIVGGTVENLTIDGFVSEGEYAPTGCVTAYAMGDCTFRNISITNCHPNTYNHGVAGIVGWDDGGDDETAAEATNYTFENITIDNSNIISALWGSWDVAAGGLMGYLGKYSKVDMKNCHVAAQIDVYNDVCGNYQYYWYRYSGMMIGTIDHHTTDANGYTVPYTGNITAADCTVHFGDWNDYYYCELVDNSIASYTHDHQFSRLTQVDSVDTVNKTVTVNGDTVAVPAVGRSNYVVVNGEAATENATCYHFKDGEVWNHEDGGYETTDIDGDGVIDSDQIKEDRQHYYLPFNQLFTGYGWGVKNIPVYNGEDYAFDGITILDREVADSVVKFEMADSAKDAYTTETTVTVGELFAAIENLDVVIDKDNVQVSISPADEESSADGVYTANTDDWTQGTLTFSGVGKAIITITDYYFCTPTTMNVTVEERKNVDKFEVIGTAEFDANGETVALGALFAEKDGVAVNSETVTVTISGVDAEVSYNTDDWTQGTVKFTGTGTAIITITDNDYCNTASKEVTVNAVDKFTVKFKNTDEYLYRVGNNNAVALSSLFEATGIEHPVNVSVESLNGETNVTCNIKGNNSTEFGSINLDFAKTTGPVRVTVTEKCANPVDLTLEVVDGNNVTSYGQITNNVNSVLLNDVTMSGETTRYSNCTIFGNGFTLDISSGANKGVSASNYSVIGLADANLDNIQIKGAIFTSYGVMTSAEYSAAAIGTTGDCTISNSYISNCLSPVKALSGTLTLDNTTLCGGRYCNLDVRGAKVVLDGVTTINTSAGGTKAPEDGVLGVGIAVHYQNSDDAVITIGEKGLKQHNWIYIEGTDTATGDNQYFKNDPALRAFFTMMFDVDNKYVVGDKTYVNAGIVSLNSKVDKNVVSVPANYVQEDVSYNGYDGYLWTPGAYDAATLSYDSYAPSRQGYFEPIFKWNHPTGEYSVENNKIVISFNEGESYTFNPNRPTATKSGNSLPVTVRKDGELCTESITFTESAEHTFTYEYTDPFIYGTDGSDIGDKTYTHTCMVTVSAIKVDVAAPTFTFTVQDNGGTYTGKAGLADGDIDGGIKTVEKDGQLWIMPNVTSADVTAFGSSSAGNTGSIGVLNGIYFPIIDGAITYKNGTIASKGTITRHYPFYGLGGTSGSVTIADDVTYSSDSAKEGPLFYSEYDGTQGVGVGSADDFGLATGVTSAGATCTTCVWGISSGEISGGTSKDYGNNINSIYYAKFSYTAVNGQTYYYYVGYAFDQQTKAAQQDICVTGDTLVDLADGTKKRIDEVTYEDELLVWNFFDGEYATAPASIIFYHGDREYEVLKLEFEDGITVKAINNHGFFDIDENKFVFIDESNVNDYIGHSFVKVDGDSYKTVKLIGSEVLIENTGSYSIQSAKYNNFMVEGMFSITMPAVEGWFDYFEIGDNLKYDEVKMQADIERYGLYTYEDFAEYVTYDQFIAFNGPYLKVLVGRGIVTYEGILELIATYVTPAE